ncbi:hypothetical protein OBV_32350 [Oscillibacter valericigenes Sjm18-20]|nr:hypothetical protein OBV_32350 [Oscillibacter valericigenes Sjm18-20]
MKKIDTQGIAYIEPLEGSKDWYWGTDYTSGDLYEAEELFKQGHPIHQNRLMFVHYPDGKTIQPLIAEDGQYFGRPICYDSRICILMVDFPNGKIKIMQFDDELEKNLSLIERPLSAVEDCYNLMLKTSPLMLTRQSNDNKFQILWPEKVEFDVENTESFSFRIGESLYFSAWYEDPEYREEVILRTMDKGKITDRFPGSITMMPDGQMWIIG